MENVTSLILLFVTFQENTRRKDPLKFTVMMFYFILSEKMFLIYDEGEKVIQSGEIAVNESGNNVW